ncbi:MAG: acyl-CoA dehydrogenase family protein [Acidimicrobiia bacterium]
MSTSIDADRALVTERLAELLAKHDPATTDPVTFLGAQYDLGLAWVHFENGYGGLGVSAKLQSIVDERLRELNAPSPWGNFIGIAQSAAAINAVGTKEQKARFLRPAFTNEEMWCQLFSEPGAGSDLAGLSTSAVRDGDEWIVNGQKVWTSGAMRARWSILLARTNPDVPKHRGLTFFVFDMKAPGVEIRPIRQADGGAHFNEVFLTDVRLPDSLRLGDVGQGWGISITGLSSEREGVAVAMESPMDQLLEIWNARDDKTSPMAVTYRDRLVKLWIDARLLELSNLRAKANQGKGGPGNEGSGGKVGRSRLNQRIGELAEALLGAEGMLGGLYDLPDDQRRKVPQLNFVRSRANSIEGGTSEIMMNILGERVLGLPGDIRVDKELPWKQVPR